MKLSFPSFQSGNRADHRALVQPVVPGRGRSLARSTHTHRMLAEFSDANLSVDALRPGTGRTPSAMMMGRGRQRAFTLIEIMVVTVLLAVIIIGLVSMFAQTQKAFRASMTQVDVLESGRAVTELLTRDLEQITPSYRINAVNFYAQIPNVPPLVQPITGNPVSAGRTNVMEEIFFVARENQTWKGFGYRVSDPVDGMGSLYRFATNYGFGADPAGIFRAYNNTSLSGMSRIVDGVVHFKVRAFDTANGWQTSYSSIPFNARVESSAQVPSEVGLYYYSNNIVPAFVEIELGVLEERARDRALAIPAGFARSNYLAQQAGSVHLFRIRVPVRNVDPAAYQ